MSVDAITYIRILPMSTIPATAGQGSGVPVTIDLTTAGDHLLSELGVPSDRQLTIELNGGGAGGAGSPVGSSPGGGGGGGGAYVMYRCELADLGTAPLISVADTAAGGIANSNGTDGNDTYIQNNDDTILIAHGGSHGVAVAGVGGAGGAVEVATELGTVLLSKSGTAGTTASTAAGGKGGDAVGPALATGGAGGTGTSGAGAVGSVGGGGGGGGAATVGVGGAGGRGWARISFPLS